MYPPHETRYILEGDTVYTEEQLDTGEELVHSKKEIILLP